MNINFKKEIIKVFIILDNNSSGILTKSHKDYDGNVLYSGFTWELWKQIESNLKEKYDFIVTFSKNGEDNYEKFVNFVYKQKYDIVIGGFNHNSMRQRLVDFTYPFIIDANTILYKKSEGILTNFKSVLFSSNAKLLLFLLIAGCFFGVLLYFFDPNRVKNLNISFENHKKYLLRSILTGISTMLGEMGYLSENSSLSYLGIILVVFIMIVAYIFALFFQASITKTLIEQQQDIINKNNIRNFMLLGSDGDDSAKKIGRYTNKIKFIKNKTLKEMVTILLNNEDKYDGLILSYCNGIEFIKKHPSLSMTLSFGYEPQSFIINPKKKYFLKDVNIIIAKLKFTLKLKKMCGTYFENIDGIPICKL